MEQVWALVITTSDCYIGLTWIISRYAHTTEKSCSTCFCWNSNLLITDILLCSKLGIPHARGSSIIWEGWTGNFWNYIPAGQYGCVILHKQSHSSSVWLRPGCDEQQLTVFSPAVACCPRWLPPRPRPMTGILRSWLADSHDLLAPPEWKKHQENNLYIVENSERNMYRVTPVMSCKLGVNTKSIGSYRKYYSLQNVKKYEIYLHYSISQTINVSMFLLNYIYCFRISLCFPYDIWHVKYVMLNTSSMFEKFLQNACVHRSG